MIRVTVQNLMFIYRYRNELGGEILEGIKTLMELRSETGTMTQPLRGRSEGLFIKLLLSNALRPWV
jgi:hypothetical protein